MGQAHSIRNTATQLRSLQVLRAIAATSVVFYHTPDSPIFGSFGVDIFFVISGFVMAMIVTGGQSPHTFAVSRLTRIVPLYWILTTLLLAIAAVKPELLNSTTANLVNYLKSLFFVPYFKENGSLQPMLTVGWTLNYEMFFYLCVWFAMVTARKFYFPVTALMLGAAFIGLGHNSADLAVRSFFGRTLIFEFLLGMIAFEIFDRGFLPRLPAGLLIAVACMSYTALAIFETTDFNATRALIYGVPSFFLVLSFVGLEGPLFIGNSQITGTLATIGDASYATYLSHLYVVQGIRKIGHERFGLINPNTFAGVVVAIFASLLVGHIVFVLLDKPISTHLKRWALAFRVTRSEKPMRAVQARARASRIS